MITIENKQTVVAVPVDQLKEDAQKLLDALGYGDFDLGIGLLSDQEMARYNKKFRNKEGATDVLSFPFWSDLKPGEQIMPADEDEKNLGDILFAPAYMKADLSHWDRTFEEHQRHLLVHGICHLLGYDHIDDQDHEVMRQKEEQLLRLLEQK